MIAESVWGDALDSFTNIIDVYVNYLRKKVDYRADSKLIHTVRGVGYLFGGKLLSNAQLNNSSKHAMRSGREKQAIVSELNNLLEMSC